MDELRKLINEVDNSILELLSKRDNLAVEVIKKKNLDNLPLRDAERERQLLGRIIEQARKLGLDTHFIQKIFYEIIDESIRTQQLYLHKSGNKHLLHDSNQKIRVAIQGIEGAYSYLASQKFFSKENAQIEYISKEQFEEVIQAVENEEADYAVLPIENTTSGAINEVYDLLMNTTLSIIGEEKFQVKHCLVGTKDVSIGSITKIYAHYQAAVQCSSFLATLPNSSVEYFKDTAMSVQRIKVEENPLFAAIASEQAAEFFGLKILRKNIANQPGNYTRFLIASRKAVTVDNRIPAKISMILATTHSPGSLVEALSVFKRYGINMTKLQSRPIMGNPWEEMFYLDFMGNLEDDKVQNLIDELGIHTRFMKILGCYPSKEIDRTKLEEHQLEVTEAVESASENSEEKKTVQKPIIKKSYKLASREYKSEDTIIKVGGVEIGGNEFVVMSGPCSVESKEQILSCAKEAKSFNSQILRGGCFKPRTSPYSFQGLGFEGLNYLKEAGTAYNMPIITEVLSTSHVFEIAKYSDMLQVGARNMQNFELLKQVGKTARPVMLKRGMMATLNDLLNAAEYILAQGNRQVILCERGIRTFENATRNTLDISAVPVLKELTHLPVIVDPSHAVGFRDKVIPLAKAAKVVGAHGIMVEFHPDPSVALSDGEQALTYDMFEQLMRDLQAIK